MESECDVKRRTLFFALDLLIAGVIIGLWLVVFTRGAVLP